MTTAQHRSRTALFAAVAALLGAAACTSSVGSAPGAGALSYDGIRSTAEKLRQNRAAQGAQDICPFGLDLGKALTAAGIPGTATPDGGDGRAVDGDIGSGAPPQPWPSIVSHPPELPSVPARPPHASVSCAWQVDGGTRLKAELTATTQPGVVVNLILPSIQRAANAEVDQLQQISTDQPRPGQTKLLPGTGGAALARVALKGEGDLALLLYQDRDSAELDPALTGEPLRKTTEALAAQLR
ncbi:hypothetical protein ABZW03_20030 [Kitasatospora sp. NPDC004799]|uniref:hypothetical protein n=1 Tax=Kitasatospora sp. NPDC004799 TaxID=3154460 RepID=UPI0033B3EB39